MNYRVCETLYDSSFDDTAELEGGIFENLILKKKGPEHLKDIALQGVDVIDTEDWYSEANQLYPEEDDSLAKRYDLVTQYYKNIQVPANKSICIIVVSHAAFNFNLPKRFNAKEESALGLCYCSSF